jgi:hypothetical protein
MCSATEVAHKVTHIYRLILLNNFYQDNAKTKNNNYHLLQVKTTDKTPTYSPHVITKIRYVKLQHSGMRIYD